MTLSKIFSATAALALVASPMASTAAMAQGQSGQDRDNGKRPGWLLVPVAGGLVIAGIVIATKGNSN